MSGELYTIQQINIGFQDVITSPGFKISSNLFHSKHIKHTDVELDILPPTKIHPATNRFYMIKDNIIAPEFDSTKR